MSTLIHLLIGPQGDLSQCSIACGDRAAVYALRQREKVTCPRCRQLLRHRKTRGGMAEKQLQEIVRKAALLGHWTYYHTHRSQHSPAGFPDTVMIRDSTLLVAELKRIGEIPTAAQEAWLAAFGQVRTVEVYLWTPDDMPTIVEALR